MSEYAKQFIASLMFGIVAATIWSILDLLVGATHDYMSVAICMAAGFYGGANWRNHETTNRPDL